MPLPLQPREGIDWTSPAVALTAPNGHVQSRWTRSSGEWSELEFVRDPVLHVHGLSNVFQYGQEAYEGMKAFRAPSGEINIFRPALHASRLNNSADLVSIEPVPEELFIRAVQLAVSRNADIVPPHDAKCMLYIRPFVFGTGPWFQVSPPNEYLFCVFVVPLGAYHGVHPIDALVLEDFDRAAPRGTGGGKVGGNYAPVMRWSERAKSEGFPITLHLDSQTRSEIEEFSTSGFVGFHTVEADGHTTTTVVVPDSKNIVDSITSRSIQQLGGSLGWSVIKRTIKYEELKDFSEVIACGTAATIVPIASITRKSTIEKFIYQNGDRAPGPCAQLLSQMLDDIYRGRVEDRFGWLLPVSKHETRAE